MASHTEERLRLSALWELLYVGLKKKKNFGQSCHLKCWVRLGQLHGQTTAQNSRAILLHKVANAV